jgi:hypothetical protein
MNLELPDSAVDFGNSARGAFEAAGGVDLARHAEIDPRVRSNVIAPLLADLGALDVVLGTDAETDAAAAELCRVAGAVGLPYPVVSVLSSPDGPQRPLALVAPAHPRAEHGDLFPDWLAAPLDGSQSWAATAGGSVLGTRLGSFVADLRLGAEEGPVDVSGFVVLSAWRVLGTLERALQLVIEHVTSRRQFDAPLANLQSVQFQVADIAVHVQALRELARYTLSVWSASTSSHLSDALALRVSMIETATQVFRSSHQLHGAIGFCNEHDLSILDRVTQPALRQPAGLEATTDALLVSIENSGFDSLFGRSIHGSHA